MTDPRRVVLLGSTGSIGTQTLDVAQRNRDRFDIVALAAGGRNVDLLAEQVRAWRVPVVGVARPEAAGALRERLGNVRTEIVVGPEAAAQLAQLDCDLVLNAVDGAQGLRPTLAALEAGRTVALANKESLIAGGTLVTSRAKPGQLVAVDSEHSALAQALRGGSATEVAALVLTASGGPFQGRTRAELAKVTPAQALKHPNWSMGRLVTTNSATLVNKGLEVIEAHLLFDVPFERIEVVVHPQSIVHSMVTFVDGSTLAQASPPDMRLPIALALGWPDRTPQAAPALDWTQAQTWTFEPLDGQAFPAVGLARTAGQAGALAPAVYNAANELLVDAFHSGRIAFLDIVDLVGVLLEEWLSDEHAVRGNPGTVADVEDAQDWARGRAAGLIRRR